tara:strand:- start:87 stop:239 length:153 start_codon:yes stop_codon:yes gene_type:complete
MRYGLFLKNSDEAIAKVRAESVEDALMQFAEAKLLSPTALLKIYRIKRLQ